MLLPSGPATAERWSSAIRIRSRTTTCGPWVWPANGSSVPSFAHRRWTPEDDRREPRRDGRPV